MWLHQTCSVPAWIILNLHWLAIGILSGCLCFCLSHSLVRRFAAQWKKAGSKIQLQLVHIKSLKNLRVTSTISLAICFIVDNDKSIAPLRISVWPRTAVTVPPFPDDCLICLLLTQYCQFYRYCRYCQYWCRIYFVNLWTVEDMEDVGEVLELCLQLWHRFGFLDCSCWNCDPMIPRSCWNMLKAVTKQWRCAQRQLSLNWQFKTRKKNEDKKIAVVLSWQLLVRTPVRSSAFQPGPEAQFETQIAIEEDWGFRLTCLDSRLWRKVPASLPSRSFAASFVFISSMVWFAALTCPMLTHLEHLSRPTTVWCLQALLKVCNCRICLCLFPSVFLHGRILHTITESGKKCVNWASTLN